MMHRREFLQASTLVPKPLAPDSGSGCPSGDGLTVCWELPKGASRLEIA
jgi:hypothetical protein